MKTSILSNKFVKILVATVFWLAVWYILAAIIHKEIFLPYPHKVVEKFFVLAKDLSFIKTVAVSLHRIIVGFVFGVALGFGLALITHKSSFAMVIFSPAIRVARATPVVSFILLAFLWLDNDNIPIFIALLMVLPIVWQNVLAGLENRDKKLKEMAKVFGISPIKVFFKITLPEIKPYFFSGTITSLGLAWKSGIAAEVISYPGIAIGKEMNNAKVMLETTDVFVWTITVVALSLILEGLLRLVMRSIEEETTDDRT